MKSGDPPFGLRPNSLGHLAFGGWFDSFLLDFVSASAFAFVTALTCAVLASGWCLPQSWCASTIAAHTLDVKRGRALVV